MSLMARMFKRSEPKVAKMDDIFRPRTEPAQSLYDAFGKESLNRKNVPVEVWCEREIDAVHTAAGIMAEKMGLNAPTRAQVVAAEAYARGSADYGATWAYKVVDRMREPPQA